MKQYTLYLYTLISWLTCTLCQCNSRKIDQYISIAQHTDSLLKIKIDEDRDVKHATYTLTFENINSETVNLKDYTMSASIIEAYNDQDSAIKVEDVILKYNNDREFKFQNGKIYGIPISDEVNLMQLGDKVEKKLTIPSSNITIMHKAIIQIIIKDVEKKEVFRKRFTWTSSWYIPGELIITKERSKGLGFLKVDIFSYEPSTELYIERIFFCHTNDQYEVDGGYFVGQNSNLKLELYLELFPRGINFFYSALKNKELNICMLCSNDIKILKKVKIDKIYSKYIKRVYKKNIYKKN